MERKGQIGIYIIVGIIALLLIGGFGYFAFQQGFFQQITGNVFVKPDWARLECSPTDAYEGTDIKWLDQQTLFRCNANTEECRFTIDLTNRAGVLGGNANYRVCDLDGNNCGSIISEGFGAFESPKRLKQFFIDNGKSLKFLSDSNKIRVIQEWKPWGLYKFVGGSKIAVNTRSCEISSSERARILDNEDVDKLMRQGGVGTKWINYVDDWNYGPATNIVNYQGQEAYCTAGAVYDIVELELANGQIVKINPEYSDRTESGQRINGLGNRIANVECCPNEPSCTKDFEFVSADDPNAIQNQQECFSDTQCFNSGNPVPQSGTTYSVYQCIERTCQKSDPITVECTTSAQCGNGQICDLSSTNYGKCIAQKTGEFCGDGVCQITENKEICFADCGQVQRECSFGQEYRQATNGALFGLFEGKPAGCYTADWVKWIITLTFLTIIGGIISLILYFRIRN